MKPAIRALLSMILFSVLGPSSGFGAERGDGQISFYTYHLKEKAAIRYRDGDRLLSGNLKKIEDLFRSRDSDRSLPIDPALIELIDRIEDHFGVRQVEVISGYRSSAFNRQLKETGHHVANESFHTKAMAADLHLDEISEEALRDYASSLKRGGVGYYPSLNMVHVDIGPPRTWAEPGARKEWVGEKTDYPLTLTVRPDRTFDGRLEKLTVEGKPSPIVASPSPKMKNAAFDPLPPWQGLNVRLQFFDGGEWEDRGAVSIPEKDWKVVSPGRLEISLKEFSRTTKDLPFGKYRLIATTLLMDSTCQYSNEFYLKKK